MVQARGDVDPYEGRAVGTGGGKEHELQRPH